MSRSIAKKQQQTKEKPLLSPIFQIYDWQHFKGQRKLLVERPQMHNPVSTPLQAQQAKRPRFPSFLRFAFILPFCAALSVVTITLVNALACVVIYSMLVTK